MRRSSFVAVALSGLLLACASKEERPPYIRTPVNSDMQTFARYVNMPEKAKAVTFETFYRAKPNAVPGPSDWSLTAVLTYDQPALQHIQEQSHPEKDSIKLEKWEARSWFPRALRDSLVQSGGGFVRFTGPAYQAKLFRKAPLSDGMFTVVNNYLFLEMDCCGPMTDQPSH